MKNCGKFWHFTDESIRKLFTSVFGFENIKIETYGHVLATMAFLQEVSVENLPDINLLDQIDNDYQGIICIKAQNIYI